MHQSRRQTEFKVVQSGTGAIDRVGVAAAHIESAIAHLNDAAQRRMPVNPGDDPPDLDELRLLVRALADIRDALRNRTRSR